MNRYFIILISIFFIACTEANIEVEKSSTPLSVNSIETHRVREEMIRIIVHNSAFLPRIDIERIATPELKLLERYIIDSLILKNGKVLDFNDDKVAGVFSNKITIKDMEIHIPFEYFPARGSSFLVDCSIFIGEQEFEPMQCTRKDRPKNS